jgi:hypothetical protein
MSKPIPYQNGVINMIEENKERYVSLNDLCDGNSIGKNVIRSWLRMRATLEFLGNWEGMHNPKFDLPAYDAIMADSRKVKFDLKITTWLEKTAAIGILRKKEGRVTHTYAHPDIALEFASFLSPNFRIYLFKEFQRLKEEEKERSDYDLQWNVRRELSKINYRIHAEAVRKYIPPKIDDLGKKNILASEGDLLNIALFGMTAKEWRVKNSEKKGNLRDEASLEQLTVLANLENLNAYLMEHGFEQDERLELLNREAIKQMELLLSYDAVKGLENLGNEEDTKLLE